MKFILNVGIGLLSLVIGLNSRRISQYVHSYAPNLSMIGLCGVSWLIDRTNSVKSLLIASVIFGNVFGRGVKMIGLTGGIACGKSTVVDMIRDISPNIAIIDSDKIAREVVRPGRKAYNGIIKAFGNSVIQGDGQINRSALGDLIFADKAKRNVLNKIIQPVILWNIVKQLVAFKLKGYDVVLDAPLLYESKVLQYFCYPIVVLHVKDEEEWISRLCKRDLINPMQAKLKIESQMPIQMKVKQADFAIDNSSSVGALNVQVRKIFKQIIK